MFDSSIGNLERRKLSHVLSSASSINFSI